MTHSIPLLLSTIDVVCAACYAWQKDWPRTAYWLSAAVLTWSTTKMH